jgi:outer membrane receptor protein involved in Fe transport
MQGASGIGNLTVNANVEIERLSDTGTLRTFGYGLNWSPIAAINLTASATNEQGAPTVEQLGAPLVSTPNARIFDFTRREVVGVTRIDGGNPNLRFDDRHVVKFGINARPFAGTDFTLAADYVRTRIDHPIANFPIVTPEIEAAFPERFARDGDGRLLRVDSRPLNFRRSDQAQLRWGFNLTKPLGSLPPELQNVATRFVASEAEVKRTLPPGATFTKVEPGSPSARRFENMTSRVFASLYHTWHLEDAILVRDGGPVLKLLNGGAIDVRGGRRRHELEFQAGVFKRGLGARVTANWQSGTTARAVGGSAGDLRFSSLATLNINLFANVSERFRGAPPWLKATRATIGVTNLFDTRATVRDRAGTTPLNYQSAYADPLGRMVMFSLRKIF